MRPQALSAVAFPPKGVAQPAEKSVLFSFSGSQRVKKAVFYLAAASALRKVACLSLAVIVLSAATATYLLLLVPKPTPIGLMFLGTLLLSGWSLGIGVRLILLFRV